MKCYSRMNIDLESRRIGWFQTADRTSFIIMTMSILYEWYRKWGLSCLASDIISLLCFWPCISIIQTFIGHHYYSQDTKSPFYSLNFINIDRIMTTPDRNDSLNGTRRCLKVNFDIQSTRVTKGPFLSSRFFNFRSVSSLIWDIEIIL